MSFSISDSKVEELLKSTSKVYEASGSPLGITTNNYAPCYVARGATYTAPNLVTEESRERLMALRRKIEGSGMPLKGADELTKEIGDMRGRR